MYGELSNSGWNRTASRSQNLVIANLEKTVFCQEIYNELIARRKSNRNDTRLHADGGIEQVYTEAIVVVAERHNNL